MNIASSTGMNGFKRTALCLLAGLLAGCAGVGPRSISMGRAAYNEAINTTEDEQMLLSVVKGRYGETFSLLAVNGVAANVSFGSTAGVEAGIGHDSYFDGNLVPFSGGVAYEENPTITYSPVLGEKYLKQLLSPISLDVLVLLIRNQPYTDKPLVWLADRVNDMQNRGFMISTQPDPRFERFVELFCELNHSGVLLLGARPDDQLAPLDVLITRYAPTMLEPTRELLALLEFPMPQDTTEDIVIPLYDGVKGREVDGLAISPRSTFDLIQILKASVDVPQEHQDEGLAFNFPPLGAAGKDVHIRSSKDKPEHAAVAVKHRGYWFYIDDKDMNTKIFYLTVRTLWSTSIAGATDNTAAPVMTIPVSR